LKLKRKNKVFCSCYYHTVIKIKKGSDLDMKKHVALFSSVLMMSTTLLGTGSVFAAANDSTNKDAQTPVTATLQPADNGGTNPLPPKPGEGEGDNQHNPSLNTKMGFAYYPKAFTIEATKLQDSGEQVIPFKKSSETSTFNLGVKDKTRDTKGWTVTANLEWDSNRDIAGASIQTKNTGVVKVNQNNGSDDFQSGNLVPENENKVTPNGNVNITNDKVTIMTGNELTGGKIHNAVYDYDLGDVELKIPDTTNITSGEKSGKVKWNLEITPSV
ncbi:hypothetical protein, partial [Enterococcus faecium]|uniref:hypothetical protein n=1 Tax=Enterococcus faecium TaxID=1352 RepID=UPI001E377E69